MEYIKEKITYYFYNNKKEESSYIFDIQSEEDTVIKKKVGFGIDQEIDFNKKECINKVLIESESVFDYKYILTLFVSILLLSVKILYTKLIYK